MKRAFLTEQDKLSAELAARIIRLQGYGAFLRFIAQNKDNYEQKLARKAVSR